MMLTDPQNPADEHIGESPSDTSRDGPSLEEVVARVKRVRPQPMSSLSWAIPDLAGHLVGRYIIRRIVGRGAFGVVYQAHDEQLGRDVAIKVPRPEVLFDEEKLRRFESEAATAATLEHPSIIPIYEADFIGPTPYIASAFCPGPDLGEWLSNLVSAIPVEQAARFVIKLAEAVHYAHRQGVLHRDLKPSNILLEPCHKIGIGKNQLEHFEPKLTDFGLAKLLESGREDTRSGMMLGTPRYMAPEQFDRKLGDVGVSCDVYALGAILYELLLGRPVIEGSSHAELLMAILERDVTPPSRIRAAITPTLEAICLKSLAKHPQTRYATALDFAEDLGRYLRGEPTHAKPLTLPRRIVKWVGVNRFFTGLMAVVMAWLVGLVLGVFWHNHQLSAQLAVSDRLRRESAESADRLLRANYVSDMQLAQQAMTQGRYTEAGARLKKYQPGCDDAKVVDFAWHLLSVQLKRSIVEFDDRGPLTALATSDVLGVSATGGKDRQIVSAGSEGASAWSFGNLLGGEKIHVARGKPLQMVGPAKVNSVALVTSHRLIRIAFQPDIVRDVGLHEEGQPRMEVALSSLGNLVAACEEEDLGGQESLRVFVTDGKGENKRVLFSGKGCALGMDVSPSGQFVAATTPDRSIRIWRAPDFQETVMHNPLQSKFAGFLLDDTGKRLYLQPTNIHEMTILDVATSEPVAKLSNVESLLNRSADGRFLAISKTDYSVAIYDTQLGETIQTLPNHTSAVVGGCFSPIEPLLATITNGGQITLWALDTGEMVIQFQASFRQPPVLGAILGFVSGGRTLVAAGGFIGKENLHYSEIRVWRVP